MKSTRARFDQETALVVSRSRRWLEMFTPEGGVVRGKATPEADEATVGDFVRTEKREGHLHATEVLERHTFLSRTYGRTTRRIAANVDRIFVVSAPPPLLNTTFIDRVLVAARLQEIPCTLVMNKSDLGLEECAPFLETYESLPIEVLRISAQGGNGVESLKKSLRDPGLLVAVLCGVSGVGKSTILNRLVPDAERVTGTVSDRTGQGRQTTTQSYAYRYPREDMGDCFLVDLPGIQNFGISDLEPRNVELSFPDFGRFRTDCEYADCLHLAEPMCGVKRAIETGLLAEFRYHSYRQILDEIERMREY